MIYVRMTRKHTEVIDVSDKKARNVFQNGVDVPFRYESFDCVHAHTRLYL